MLSFNLRLWRNVALAAAVGSALASPVAHAQAVTGVQFRASSGLFAVFEASALRLYAREGPSLTARLRVETAAPQRAVWTDSIVALPGEHEVRVLETARGSTLATVPFTGRLRSVSLDARGQRLLVFTAPGVAAVHALPSGQRVADVRNVRCADLSPEGALVTATAHAVERRADPAGSPVVVPLQGAVGGDWCSLVRHGSLLVEGEGERRWAFEASTGRRVLSAELAPGDNLEVLDRALEGDAPVLTLPSSSWQRAATLDLRLGRRLDRSYTPPRCSRGRSSCPPSSHTYIIAAATRGDSVVSLGLRDVDDYYGNDTIFLVDGAGAVQVVAAEVPESEVGLSPDGAWVVRLQLESRLLELIPTAGGPPRRAECPHNGMAFSLDGHTLVTWRGAEVWRWRVDAPELQPEALH